MERWKKYEQLLIEQTLAELDGKEFDSAGLKEISEYFLSRSKPAIFNPYSDDCILIEKDKQFENVCISMEENGLSNPKELTVFEFYKRIEYFEKKAEELNRKIK